MLHNVRIKVEAFDALDLPFDIKEGTIGRLAVQASAGFCSGTPLVQRHMPSCGGHARHSTHKTSTGSLKPALCPNCCTISWAITCAEHLLACWLSKWPY